MRLTEWIDKEHLIHSLKTAIACLLGILFIWLVDLPGGQWVIITIIVVMCAQIYVGSVFQKAYLRFLGTLAGCVIATLVIRFIGTTPLISAITIAIASFLFSYIATSRDTLTYTGTLGAVTTAIIMLGHPPTIAFALERFVEIASGIIIATLVSQFVLPIHARTHLRHSQADTLLKLRDYYIAIIATRRPDHKINTYQELDESIVKNLSTQRKLAKESIREPLGLAFNPAHFSRTLTSERDLLRAITFMLNALDQAPLAYQLFANSATIKAFNDAIIQSLNTLINVLTAPHPLNATISLPSMRGLKEKFQQYKDQLPEKEIIYSDGFLFSMEILVNSLRKLAELYHVTCINDENK